MRKSKVKTAIRSNFVNTLAKAYEDMKMPKFGSFTSVLFERQVGRSSIVSCQGEKFLIKNEHLSGDASKFTKGESVQAIKEKLNPIIHNSKN